MHGVTEENRRIDDFTGRWRAPVPFVVDGSDAMTALRRAWAELDSTPGFRPDRDSGIDYSWPGFDVRTLLDGDNSSGRATVHDVRLEVGAGLPKHYQESAHTYIFVIEGEIELTIGGLSEASGPGTVGYAPPHTTQGFRNHGSGVAHLFLGYLPAGAERGFREAHELWQAGGDTSAEPYLRVLSKYGFCFDFERPLDNDALTNSPVSRYEAKVETPDDFESLREGWRRRAAVPKLVHDRSQLAMVGVSEHELDTKDVLRSRVMVSGDDDSGCAVFFDGITDPGYSAPPHHQPTEEEMFFILEGEYELTCGSQTRRVGPGAFGFAPRNATHGFLNVKPTGYSRMLTVNSPAGHERGFEMVARETANGPKDDFMDLMEAHGWNIHDPAQLGPQLLPEGVHEGAS